MKCISYDGILFADLHVGAGIDPLTDQGPYRSPIVLRRAGTSPIHAGVDQDAATTSVTFTVKPTYATETTLLALLGALNPDNDQERPFVGLLDDGVTQVSRNTAIATWRFSNANRLIVDFSAADPIWRAASDTTGTPIGASNELAALNPSFLTDLSGWQTDTSSGTPVWSWDGTVYHANAGSLNLAWVGPASTSPIGAAYRNTTFIACAPGEHVTLSQWCRTDNTDVIPLLRLSWYNGAHAVLSTSVEADWTPVANTWTQRTLTAVAPAGTAVLRVTGAAVKQTIISQTASVNFDEVKLTFADRISLPNAGQATAHPEVSIAWIAQRTDDTADVGWKYRKSITITNNGSQPLNRRPWRLSLGSTTALVSGSKALSSGDDVRLLDPYGVELSRTLLGWNTGTTYLWFLLDLQPGEAKTFAVIYGNPSAADPGDLHGINRPVFDITASSNTLWVYLVEHATERSDNERGLWYVNKAQTEPSSVRYDAPGSWRPFLYLDNRDAKAQDPYTMALVGVSDLDTFAILRARRTWSGGNSTWSGIGEADGVAFSSALPITHINIDYQWYNPNGIGKFLIAQKEAQAEKWAEVFSDSTTEATLTSESVVNVSLTDSPRHLYLGVIPADGDQVDLSRTGDSGSITASGADTVTDSSSLWHTKQWVGATCSVRIPGSSGYDKRTVTNNSATLITVDPDFGYDHDGGDQYLLQFRGAIPYAEADSDETCELTFDTSDISVGSLGGEASVYDLNATLKLDGDVDGSDYPYRTIEVGYGGTGRRLLLNTVQRLVIDCERMRADIYTNSVWNKAVPWAVDPRAIDVDDVTDAETDRLADDWLPISPGTHTLYVSEDAMGTLDVDVTFRAGYLL